MDRRQMRASRGSEGVSDTIWKRERRMGIRKSGGCNPFYWAEDILKNREIATGRGEGMRSEGWRAAGSVTTDDVVEQPRPFKGGA